MHLQLSNNSYPQMTEFVRLGHIPEFPETPLEVFWTAPDQPVEVWDRILQVSGSLKENQLLTSEYAGETPTLRADGRRYRRRFNNPWGRGEQVVTFASSRYTMRPESAILQIKLVADRVDLKAISATIIVCDQDNRTRLRAFLQEDLQKLEAEDVKDFPEREVERVPVHV